MSKGNDTAGSSAGSSSEVSSTRVMPSCPRRALLARLRASLAALAIDRAVRSASWSSDASVPPFRFRAPI